MYSFSFNNRRRRRRCRREAAAVRPPEAAERTDLGTHRLEESGYSTQLSLFHSTPFIPLHSVYSRLSKLLTGLGDLEKLYFPYFVDWDGDGDLDVIAAPGQDSHGESPRVWPSAWK